jgi:hypothetical protein
LCSFLIKLLCYIVHWLNSTKISKVVIIKRFNLQEKDFKQLLGSGNIINCHLLRTHYISARPSAKTFRCNLFLICLVFTVLIFILKQFKLWAWYKKKFNEHFHKNSPIFSILVHLHHYSPFTFSFFTHKYIVLFSDDYNTLLIFKTLKYVLILHRASNPNSF